MFAEITIERIVDYILFFSCLFILFGSLFISFKMRFVQLRLFPTLFKMLTASVLKSNQKEGAYTILPYRALFTAMSTTIGIGTIVGPVIAIHWGGPGALLGFLLTAFLGSAATYTEVNLCIRFRKKLENGQIQGGPMQYLQAILSPAAAKWYALIGCLLMTAWSAAQANQLAAILDSPLLGDYRIPTVFSGAFISLLVLVTLMGGIKRVSSLSSKLVPLMFTLYIGSSLWIIGANIDQFGAICQTIVSSAFQPYAMATGALVGGFISSMRWGVFKGTQATEAGVGTQTIPHSMAETKDSVAQGTLAMLSTYTSGLISFISGCVALMTETWQDPELPLGISMVAASFKQYFSHYGVTIVAISTFLFAFGTILGNSYNGSQCLGYLTGNKSIRLYYIVTACVIFIGTISGVKTVWSVIDIGLAFLVIPHMSALVRYVSKRSGEILGVSSPSVEENAPVRPAYLAEETAINT
ncbi:alanine/glycine:cation symporter family protein [Candidatus Protochlamydia phocaeensis]|uniref:alanine/glycine:cation symporter family protein n=1 Tax=Candidatus Protochlamydia phocaeensis TaxID=1414722 RepID=UPI00083860ED|nr:amino acid carrier protein [Candidatus Protochlamydia phocaeensis]